MGHNLKENLKNEQCTTIAPEIYIRLSAREKDQQPP